MSLLDFCSSKDKTFSFPLSKNHIIFMLNDLFIGETQIKLEETNLQKPTNTNIKLRENL